MADKAIIKQFIIDNPFGILVSTNKKEPIATHIPFEFGEIKGEWVLEGHISRANEQWKYFNTQEKVLCIFQAEHAYISSSWYSFLEVPTWNYMAAHLYGKIELLTDMELYKSLQKLVNHYEKGRPNAFSMDKYEEQKMFAKMKGVVGFRIKVTEISANFKLSQNRSETDYRNIIEQLKKENNPESTAIALAMENRISEIY